MGIEARAVHWEVAHVERAPVGPPAFAVSLDLVMEPAVQATSQVNERELAPGDRVLGLEPSAKIGEQTRADSGGVNRIDFERLGPANLVKHDASFPEGEHRERRRVRERLHGGVLR